ncbi:hypothetical protein PM082_022589 [Marasmius tenuissimus]|nr:hypothetical protein PM082_022589 [Marasmius tenuissimus]
MTAFTTILPLSLLADETSFIISTEFSVSSNVIPPLVLVVFGGSVERYFSSV